MAKFIDDEFRRQINQAMEMLSKEEKKILKDYTERSRQKYSEADRKKVFKKLRVHLKTIKEKEEG